MPIRRDRAAAERYAERRRREDEAPRLAAIIPNLKSLRLEVQDDQGLVGRRMAHTRWIVVEGAPALFFVPCGDPMCRDGGHELTRLVLGALELEERLFEVDHDCDGTVRAARCRCNLHVTGIADYVLSRILPASPFAGRDPVRGGRSPGAIR